VLSSCNPRSIVAWGRGAQSSSSEKADSARITAIDHSREREAARARLPATPRAVIASSPRSAPIRKAALSDRKMRVVVSTAERVLWLMRDTTVLLVAPVAVGMHQGFTWAGRTYDFKTPHSRRVVQAKGEDPIWVPPDWHYFEKAAADGLTPVQLKRGDVIHLSDNTRIEVRGEEIGRVNQFGNFWPFSPGTEIIFEGRIYIPPIGSVQRRVPLVLGTHKLEIGDGYLIHGTNENTSIGEAVSHGCVRMYNEDVALLYTRVPVGTPVYIF
ncbi:MAG: L,D-transpeptidase, partial [Longimicrobiales bacterium]